MVIRVLKFLERRRFVRSWLGWPVPSSARIASRRDLETLIGEAVACGYSRKAADLALEDSASYVLIPYMYESTPVSSWMCLAIAAPKGFSEEAGERPRLSYGRLDISLSSFARLRPIKRRDSATLLHWLAWEAAHKGVANRDSG